MFPCTSCGICCKNITHIPELKELDLGNGTCKYFKLNIEACNKLQTMFDVDEKYRIKI